MSSGVQSSVLRIMFSESVRVGAGIGAVFLNCVLMVLCWPHQGFFFFFETGRLGIVHMRYLELYGTYSVIL